MSVIDSIKNRIKGNLLGEILYSKSGKHDIKVVSRYSNIIMFVDGIIFSTINMESIFIEGYWDYLSLLPAVYKDPKVLLIGFGGGTIPYQISELFNISIDAVDIDKEVVDASKYMLPKKLNTNVHIGDGFDYLKDTNKVYDLIILDAYSGYNIPSEFLDGKFIDLAYDKLSEDGILAINYIPIYNNVNLLKAHSVREFHLYELSMSSSANKILILSKKLDKKEICDLIEKKSKEDYRVKHYIVESYKNLEDL